MKNTIYVIDVSPERVGTWESTRFKGLTICLVAQALKINWNLSLGDFVFAHSTDFGVDLTDNRYRSHLEGVKDFKRIPKSIDSVISFRVALRATVGSAQLPPLVIYHGEALKLEDVRRNVNRFALKGYPMEKVETEVIGRHIKVSDLENRVESIVSRLTSGKSLLESELATDRFWAIYILCDAWLLREKYPGRDYNGIKIRTPAKCNDWFRPFGKAPTKTAAMEISEGIEPRAARDAVRMFLQNVAAGNEVTKKSVANLKSVLCSSVKSDVSK